MGDKECVMEPSKHQHSLDEHGVGDGKKKKLCQPSPEDKQPPQLNFELQKTGDVIISSETWSDVHLPIDILLLTAESCDFLSCFSFLDQPFKSYKFGLGHVYFGYMGDARDQETLKVALVNCSKGAAAPGGSLTVGQNAVRVLGPKAVFSVGTCISLGLEKARIGDVVISSRLITTEGFKTPASPCLGSLARDAPYGWKAPLKHPDGWEIKVHYNGDILSQSLTAMCQIVNLCERHAGAIAIETEGEGIYAAAYDANIEWLIVKGVASYFHQSQSATDKWKSFASAMAASVVAKMLNDPTVFQEWPHYNPVTFSSSKSEKKKQETRVKRKRTIFRGVTQRSPSFGGSVDYPLASAMDSQSRTKENHGKRPIHPLETTTPQLERQNTAIPKKTSTATDQAVSAGNLSEQGQSSISEAVFYPGLTAMQQHMGDLVSSARENEIKRKRPLHPVVTTTERRQPWNASILEKDRRKKLRRPFETTSTPERQRQTADIPETDSDISVVVKLLKREYNRRAELRPLLWMKNMKLPLEKVYTRLRVVSRWKRGSWEIDVDDVLESSEKDNDPLVLVEGSPGIGKTTFCLKLIYDWANDAMPRHFPSFKLVFLLKCRDITKDVVEEIFEQLLPEDLKEKTKEHLLNFVEDLNNQEQILIILDGLDELPEESEDHVNKVLGRKKLAFCYVLATTREEKGIYTRQQFKFDLCLAITGFSEENSFEYIRKHFREIETEHSSKGERLIEEIKQNPLLRHLQSNPLNLLLLCVVYEEHEGSLPSSITDLYQTIVRCLLRRYCAKKELMASEKDEDLDKQFEINILALGELALKCLLNDRLSFYEDELEVLERSNENIVARRLGLVYKEESLKRLKPRHAYSFLHKTFQEYLAASHIAHKLRGSEFQISEQMLFPMNARWKFKQVFVFVCGILGEEANIVFEQIGLNFLRRQWDWSKCESSTASFFVESWKETGNAKGMAKTLCSFLPFSRPLHVWNDEECVALCSVLKECAELPEELTVAEVHISPSVTSKYVSDLIDVLEDVNKTLGEKLTFALFADVGERVSKVPDFGLSSVRLRICGSLGSVALQDFENLPLHKCLSSLSITVCGDVQESLVGTLARGLAGESAVKFLDLCVNGNLSFRGASLLQQGIVRNRSLKGIKVSVNGEPPNNWLAVAKNLRAQIAEKAIVSVIYPNTFSKVKDSQLTHLNRFLSKTDLKQQTATLNVWGELSGDGCKALCEVLLNTPVSHLTLNMHGQLTNDMLRYIARCVEEQEKLSLITINTWVEMTEKEIKLIKELGLDKNPLFSLNVRGTSAPLKESSDSKVVSSDEPQSLIALFEKATKGPSIFTEDTSQKSLTIKINDGTSIEWEHVFGEGLAGNTSLKSLTLEIHYFGDDNDEWGRGLGEGLARNTSLESLTIKIQAHSTSNEWEYGLGEGLAGNTSLKSLTLEFDHYGGNNVEWERGLGKGLARNTSLESLAIKINWDSTSNEWEYSLGKGLAGNTSLRSLTLEFDKYDYCIKFWGHCLCEGLARNTFLESLTFSINLFKGGSYLDWGEVLGESLAKNTSLNSLTLTINKSTHVTDRWCFSLAEGLAKNTSLKSISFTLNNYFYMSNEGAMGLFAGSASNTSLKSVTLTINNYGIMEGGSSHDIIGSLARNSSLKSITLAINNYGTMEGEWRHDIIEGLARNASLKSITLGINNFGDMKGEWGRCLFEGLARNTSLNSLTLTANNYGDMSEEWGCALRERLRKCESLTECNLIVDICGKC
ncbi:uncharacterized protein [Acropora muricata]|uniref:uncharacterized protein isoform X2 n=1 Tax=Acropora muricata TaxID=159855 RepID=UPI0034E5D2AA